MADMSSIHSLAAEIQVLPEYQSAQESYDPNMPQNPPENPFFAEKDILSRRVAETEKAEAEKWAWAWSYKFPQPILGHRSDENRWPKIRDKVALTEGISIAKVPPLSSLQHLESGINASGDGVHRSPAPETDATIVTRLLDAGADIIGYYSSASGPPPPLVAPQSPQQEGNSVGDRSEPAREPPTKRLRYTRTLVARQVALATAEENERREKAKEQKANAKMVYQPWTEGYIVPCGTEGGSAAGAALVNDKIVGAAIGIDNGGAGCMHVAASLYGCMFDPSFADSPRPSLLLTKF